MIKFRFRAIVAIAALALAACTAQIMEGFVGRDVREVGLQYGPPTHYFDLPDGRRAFQWEHISGYTTPVNTSVTMVGQPGFQQAFATTTGGQFHQFRCLYTLIGERNDQGSFTVVSFQEPAFGC